MTKQSQTPSEARNEADVAATEQRERTEKDQMRAQLVKELSQEQVHLPDNHVGVTAEGVAAAMTAAIGLLSRAMTEPVLKTRASNGKLYSIDNVPLFDSKTGEQIEALEEVEVNRFSFAHDRFLSVLPWKAESMLEFTETEIAKKKAQIRGQLKDYEAGIVSDAQLESSFNFLEQLQEQACIYGAAMDAAIAAYNDLSQKPYVTKAEQAVSARARSQASRQPNSAAAARARALGV